MDMAEASPTPKEEPMNEDLSPDAASSSTATPCCTVWKEVVVVLLSVMSDSCDPMDHSLLGSSVHGIPQARILEWAAISFSRGSS